MSDNLDARSLTLEGVYQLFKFEEHLNDDISSKLSLEPLAEFEQQ